MRFIQFAQSNIFFVRTRKRTRTAHITFLLSFYFLLMNNIQIVIRFCLHTRAVRTAKNKRGAATFCFAPAKDKTAWASHANVFIYSRSYKHTEAMYATNILCTIPINNGYPLVMYVALFNAHQFPKLEYVIDFAYTQHTTHTMGERIVRFRNMRIYEAYAL